MLEQQRANTASLMGLSHRKRHFRTGDGLALLLESDIATNADDGLLLVIAVRRHERHVAPEVQFIEHRPRGLAHIRYTADA